MVDVSMTYNAQVCPGLLVLLQLLKLLVPTVSFVVRMLMEKVVVLFVEEVRYILTITIFKQNVKMNLKRSQLNFFQRKGRPFRETWHALGTSPNAAYRQRSPL